MKNPKKETNFGVLGIVLSGCIILISAFVYKSIDGIIEILFAGCFITAVGVYIWVRKNLNLFYKEVIKKDTVLAIEKERDAAIEENKTLAEINHKYGHKISSLEHHLKNVYNSYNNDSVEFANELSEITQLVENLSNEYSEEMAQRIKNDKKLPKTNILEIDKMLEYMQIECAKNDINFDVKLKYPINYLIEKYIPRNKLEILLADHIKDAIIAVNATDKNIRKIMVTVDIIDNFYEICISDTGIPFEVQTLMKLGLEPITTHKDIGGTGYGFITTFKTLEETKGTLIIEEHDQNIHTYTKTIIFRFDNNEKYIIRSHRFNEISRTMRR